ncbi:MAG: hypothetical protein Kow00127_09830 [Bacteroidales bacterium]
MSKENKLIPELRFPEFEKDGEWVEKRLVKLAKRVLEKNKDGKIKTVFTNSANDGIVDQRDYFDKDIANKKSLENYYIVENGDYVYNPRISAHAPVGPISKNRLGKTGVMSPLYTVFRFNDNNNDFYEYYFQTHHWYSSIRKISNTGARFDRVSITASDFMKIPVLYTNPQEQQKIASCLSSLDELIAAHKDKLQALKDHKKGLMQNLFPQEGQKVPNYRFPEFRKDGEWVEKELGEVARIITGSTPSTKVPEYYGGDIMFVSPADISNNKYVESTEKTLTIAGFEKTRKVKSNSVMFVCIGSTIGKVAMNKFDCATNQQINSLVPNNENSSDFLYSNLELNASNISGIAGNQAVPIINKTLFSSVKLKFPPNIQEQQKIASCLSALDEIITAQTEKIEQLLQHKKGLMQGLFPKIEN